MKYVYSICYIAWFSHQLAGSSRFPSFGYSLTSIGWCDRNFSVLLVYLFIYLSVHINRSSDFFKKILIQFWLFILFRFFIHSFIYDIYLYLSLFYLSSYLFTYLFIYSFIHESVYLSIYLSVSLSISLSIYSFIYLFILVNHLFSSFYCCRRHRPRCCCWFEGLRFSCATFNMTNRTRKSCILCSSE